MPRPRIRCRAKPGCTPSEGAVAHSHSLPLGQSGPTTLSLARLRGPVGSPTRADRQKEPNPTLSYTNGVGTASPQVVHRGIRRGPRASAADASNAAKRTRNRAASDRGCADRAFKLRGAEWRADVYKLEIKFSHNAPLHTPQRLPTGMKLKATLMSPVPPHYRQSQVARRNHRLEHRGTRNIVAYIVSADR